MVAFTSSLLAVESAETAAGVLLYAANDSYGMAGALGAVGTATPAALLTWRRYAANSAKEP